jgi:hypothetical protein
MGFSRRTLLTAGTAALFIAPQPLWAKKKKRKARDNDDDAGGPKSNGPVVIDFVSTGKLTGATPQQQQHFLNSFARSGARTLESLGAAKVRDGIVPPDGNAPYRLAIEFQGKLWVGEPDDSLHEFDIVDAQTKRVLLDKGARIVEWDIQAGYDGVLRFKLLEWKDKAYRQLRAWQVPYKGQDSLDLVSALVTNVPVPGLKKPEHVDKVLVHPNVPPCPMTPAEIAAAKEEVLRELNPTTLWDEVTGGLVACEVVRADIRPTPDQRHVGQGGQTLDDIRPQGEVVIRLRNNSPWTLTSAHVSAAWAGPGRKNHFLTKLLQPEKPIPPGRSADVVHKGFVIEGGRPGNCTVSKATFVPPVLAAPK